MRRRIASHLRELVLSAKRGKRCKHCIKYICTSTLTMHIEPPVSMQQLLKDWRQDAMLKHQYESAIYIGDKLLAITSQ